MPYLEFKGGNSFKFWEIYRDGSNIAVRYDRIGSNRAFRIVPNHSESDAISYYNKKIKEKLNKGYVETIRPASAPSIPFSSGNTTSVVAPETKPEPVSQPKEMEHYFLSWEAGKVTKKNIREAAEITNTVIGELDIFKDISLSVNENSSGPHVLFYINDTKVAWFGFPSDSFLDSLSPREKEAVLSGGVSRDGWLSNRGTGSGTIFTEYAMFDFPVRLFLSILHNKSSNFEVTCSNDELVYSSKGFMTDLLQFCNLKGEDLFAWSKHWNIIKPVLVKHWFIAGESSFIVTESTAFPDAGLFAW